jgi:hypothetical protein
MDCGVPYDECMALDMTLPRAQWLMIHPEDGGKLCANCMIRRARKLPGAINLTALFAFNADFKSDTDTPYWTVTRLEKELREQREVQL